MADAPRCLLGNGAPAPSSGARLSRGRGRRREGGALGLSRSSREGGHGHASTSLINLLSPTVAKVRRKRRRGRGGPTRERHAAGSRRTEHQPPPRGTGVAARRVCSRLGQLLRFTGSSPEGTCSQRSRASGGASSPGRPLPRLVRDTTYHVKQLHVGPAGLRFEPLGLKPTVSLKKLLLRQRHAGSGRPASEGATARAWVLVENCDRSVPAEVVLLTGLPAAAPFPRTLRLHSGATVPLSASVHRRGNVG